MSNNNKQRLLLEYLISSPDAFALCKSILSSAYFDPEYRKTVDFIHTYYDQYSATPDPQQIDAETGVSLTKQDITRDKIEYVANEVETFCRRRAIQLAILAAPKMIAEGDYGGVEKMIKEAVLISLHRDIGLTYFEEPEDRLAKMAETPQRTSTLWQAVDELLSGGLARREIILFSANSGGGKSITLANLAVNFLAQPKYPGSDQKMDVLYISLELSEELIAQRFDTMFSGISSVLSQQKHKEIGEVVKEVGSHLGRLTIKRMPSGTNANAIRAYLKEFELTNGYIPDLLVIDYLDLMGANEKVSGDNVHAKDKQASEQLSDILYDYNMFGATASQQNRAAVDAQELNQSHIAGGISKVNAADWYISIVMTPTMKASGEIAFAFLKTRSSDGVGKTVYLKWDNTHLRIKNADREQYGKPKETNMVDHIARLKSPALAAPVIAALTPTQSRRSLLDSFDID